MSDLLSQEEIDALLSLGLGKEEDEEEAPPPQPQKRSAPPPPVQAAPVLPNQPAQAAFPTWTSQPRHQETSKARMKRSSVVEDSVNVQQAVFTTFEEEEASGETTNLEIILNLKLEIRVVLGRTTATVRDVLEMGPGSVLELEKLNGEPVDLLVNQKPFSKGEMIVIGENFGVRVTDILSVTEIIEALR